MGHVVRAIFAFLIGLAVQMTDLTKFTPLLPYLWFLIFVYISGEILMIGPVLAQVVSWGRESRVSYLIAFMIGGILGLSYLYIAFKVAAPAVPPPTIDPAITFRFENTPEYIVSPDRRKAYVDPETHQPNWAIFFKVITDRKLRNACLWVTDIKGPSDLHISLERKIGWANWEDSFKCLDVTSERMAALFICQVFKDGRQKLQLFFEPGEAERLEYKPMKDMAPGKYEIKILLSAENLSTPVYRTFVIDWSGGFKSDGDFHLRLSD